MDKEGKYETGKEKEERKDSRNILYFVYTS